MRSENSVVYLAVCLVAGCLAPEFHTAPSGTSGDSSDGDAGPTTTASTGGAGATVSSSGAGAATVSSSGEAGASTVTSSGVGGGGGTGGASACDVPGCLLTFEDPSNGHCYCTGGENMLTWDQAKLFCEERFLYVASVTGFAELQLITPLVGGAWIGGRYGFNADVFKWVNGETWNVEAWGGWEPGDPDMINTNPCVDIDDDSKKLDNDDCVVTKRVLCEFGL